jgi:hypothetical protein
MQPVDALTTPRAVQNRASVAALHDREAAYDAMLTNLRQRTRYVDVTLFEGVKKRGTHAASSGRPQARRRRCRACCATLGLRLLAVTPERMSDVVLDLERRALLAWFTDLAAA